jgi:hypothetical protein
VTGPWVGDAAPDYVEPTHAWRMWSLVETDAGVRLASPVHGSAWEPRTPLAARCPRAARRWVRRAHANVPDPACSCGVHGVPLHYLRFLVSTERWSAAPVVFGRVALWGAVIECEHGWRAARAQPAALYVPSRVRSDHLRIYGVPVEVMEQPLRAALDVVTARLAQTTAW